MAEPIPEIDALCQALYNDHKEAWRMIRREVAKRRSKPFRRRSLLKGGRKRLGGHPKPAIDGHLKTGHHTT